MIGRHEAIRIAEQFLCERMGEQRPAIRAEFSGSSWSVYFQLEPGLDPWACVEVDEKTGASNLRITM